MSLGGGGGGGEIRGLGGYPRAPPLYETLYYRRRWLLSVGAYSFCQQENEHLTANMRLTANMHLIGIPSITMGGVIIINASG